MYRFFLSCEWNNLFGKQKTPQRPEPGWQPCDGYWTEQGIKPLRVLRDSKMLERNNVKRKQIGVERLQAFREISDIKKDGTLRTVFNIKLRFEALYLIY